MNVNMPVIGRLFVLALAVALGPGMQPATAQPSGLSLAQALQQADEFYQANKWVEAEPLYRQALNAAEGADRRRCFDRLLTIYVRVGRQDQAIQTGLKYADWLRRTGDHVRARTVELDLGKWYLALGHYADAEPHLRRALADFKGHPLPPARQILALTYLALATEKQGERARAGQAWREVEAFARARLDDTKLDLALRIECVRRLADSDRFQGRPKEAIPRLEQILPAFGELKKPDPVGQRDALRQLAGHLTAARRHADAEKYLMQARALHRQHAAGDLLTCADLSGELADVLERQGRTREAATLRREAAWDYRAILEDPRTGLPEGAGALGAFWKLQVLYQRTSQYDLALKLLQDQAEQWAGDLLEPRLYIELGRLQVLLGEYAPSRRLLAGAVAELEKQSPPNLIELPAALLNLGVAELATGDRGKAKERGERCLKVYEKYRLGDDLVLLETYNLLGICAAQDGDYAKAIDHFRAGVARCGWLGSPADPQHANLLLNLALLHKAQGELEKSLAACRDARAVYQRFAAKDALGFAALDAAAAALFAARARLEEANKLAGKVLELCAKHKIHKGPLVHTARHCQALFHLHRRDYTAAEQAWREVEQLHGPESPLRPRTLNYLALTRECRGQLDEAAALYEEARRLQRQNPRAFPVTHFTTLWRLANAADRRGRQAEARALLEEAVGVVEKARLRTYGAAQQRATFFAQFAPAFEQLVAWCVRDGDVAGAAAAAARGRSRTLLDQLLLANVDPLKSLPSPQRKQLGGQAAELLRRITALRTSIQLLAPGTLKSEKARQLLADLDAAQQQYSEVYREILHASPIYRSLARQEFTTADLDRLRDRAISPKKLLLVYHVGRHQSHLLLVGDRARPPAAFALTVPADVAERVAAPPPLSLADALAKGRGIVLKGLPEQPELPPAQPAGVTVPLGQAVLRALGENYLQQVTDRKFQATRGVRLQPRDPARPLPAQRPELLADILLPAAARERIRALAPACLIIVPDGALHKLPFEALLLKAGDQPTYVLDELPPLVYAPSVAGLALLADRPPAAPTVPLSLLTVADPAYPQAARAPGHLRPPSLPGVWGQLVPLPHSAKESARISDFFDAKEVLALRGVRATKKALLEALHGRHVVHIAAHGVADERLRNLFGALVLTPAAGQEASEDDGFLALHEIYMLPLEKCELAVLSACVTNVGPQPPLEAGVTLIVQRNGTGLTTPAPFC